jgi:hypothetical protein
MTKFPGFHSARSSLLCSWSLPLARVLDRVRSVHIHIVNSCKFSCGKIMAPSLCPPWWNHFQTFWSKYFLYVPPLLCTLNLMFLHFGTLKMCVQNTNYILPSQAIFFRLLFLNVFFFVLTYFYKHTHTHTHTHTNTHTHTPGRTPTSEGSVRRRDFYLTTQNIHNSQKFLSPEGFELAIPASKWPPGSAFQ